MNRRPWTLVAHAFRRTALPLASYYAVTLALPLVNGAAQSDAFMEHALVVLVVPPVAIILACTVAGLFGLESLHGIDRCGAVNRHIARQGGRHRQDDRHPSVSNRIQWTDSKQQR